MWRYPQILYNWLNYQTHQFIDVATGGSLSNKYPDEAEQLFEDMARNESHWALKARATRVARIHEIDATTNWGAKVDALTRKFNLLMIEKTSSSSKAVMLCEIFRGGHNAF